MKTMRLVQKKKKNEEFIKERDNSLHQARKEKKKKNPSRRDKILRKHQTEEKREGYQARKDFNQRERETDTEREREREREREVNARIFIKL